MARISNRVISTTRTVYITHNSEDGWKAYTCKHRMNNLSGNSYSIGSSFTSWSGGLTNCFFVSLSACVNSIVMQKLLKINHIKKD